MPHKWSAEGTAAKKTKPKEEISFSVTAILTGEKIQEPVVVVVLLLLFFVNFCSFLELVKHEVL